MTVKVGESDAQPMHKCICMLHCLMNSCVVKLTRQHCCTITICAAQSLRLHKGALYDQVLLRRECCTPGFWGPQSTLLLGPLAISSSACTSC